MNYCPLSLLRPLDLNEFLFKSRWPRFVIVPGLNFEGLSLGTLSKNLYEQAALRPAFLTNNEHIFGIRRFRYFCEHQIMDKKL
jgi:hypothetical protein